MKRKILFGALFLLLAWAASSCEEKLCQFCKIVTRKISDNSIVSSNGGSEYCGVEVAAYKAANPTITNTVLGTITQVECN